MGRLTMRAAWDKKDIRFLRVNDPAGDAATFAHLLNYDSVHGKWSQVAESEDSEIVIGDTRVAFSANTDISDTDWSGCDVVIECSGKMKSAPQLQAYLEQGVKRVVVSAPVKVMKVE